MRDQLEKFGRLAVVLCVALLLDFAPSAFGSASLGTPGRPRAFRVMTDEVGRHVRIPGDVHRIVTLSQDLTETIYALGLQDELVGDPEDCHMPAEAALKPHIGTAREPSLEAVIALHPDLVFASGTINWLQTVQGLTRAGLAVYTTYPHTVKEMLASFEHVADAAGAASKGAALAARLQKQLDSLQTRLTGAPPVRVLFVVWDDPLMTIGQDTFIADALRYAGAESVIASKQNWPQIGIEEVLRLQPDYIIFSSGHGGSNGDRLAELRVRPGWQALDAVKLGHVEIVSEEIEQPSAGLVGVIEQLARELHPSAFSVNSSGTTTLRSSASAVGFSVGEECDSCAR